MTKGLDVQSYASRHGVLLRGVVDAVRAIDRLPRVAELERTVAEWRERRVQVQRRAIERIGVRRLARRVHQRRVVAHLLVVLERRRLVVEIVRPVVRIQPQRPQRTRVEPEHHRRDVDVAIQRRAWHRRLRDRRVDGPRQQIHVAGRETGRRSR